MVEPIDIQIQRLVEARIRLKVDIACYAEFGCEESVQRCRDTLAEVEFRLRELRGREKTQSARR